MCDPAPSSGGGGGGSSDRSSSPRPRLRPEPAPSSGGGGSSDRSSSPRPRLRPEPEPSSGGGGSSDRSSSPRPRLRPEPEPAPSSGGGRNLDADNFAGSNYAPTRNAGTSRARQVTYSSDSRGPSRVEQPVTSNTTNFQSRTSVTAEDLRAGNVTTYKAKSGTGSITVAKGTKFEDVPEVDVGGKTNAEVYDPTPIEPAPIIVNDDEPAPEKVETGSRNKGGSLKIGKIKASELNDNGLTISRKARGTKSKQIKRRV